MKTRVNDMCFGCGNCVAMTDQEIFDFNDDGLAEAVVDTVPEDKEDLVKDACESCPVSAITIEE